MSIEARSAPVSRASSTLETQNSSSSLLPLVVPLSIVSPSSSQGSPPPSPTRTRSGSFITKIAGNGHSPRRSLSGNDMPMSVKALSMEGAKDGVAVVTTTPVTAPCPVVAGDVQLSGNYEDYDIKTPIGYGSSAVVYNAIYKPLQKRVAIKMIDLDQFERNQIDELRRETQLMALSKHQNVLRVYGSFVHGSKLYIVTPFLAGGSCLEIMKTYFPDGFDEIIIATILKQALEGLIYFHKNGHIHRDVKAGNLLMDEDGTVLLADFGVSSSCIESGERGVRRTFVGTPCWMAPEVMEQAGYNSKADIWSFGITAIELATGHAPFAKYPPLKVLMMTLSSEPPTLERDMSKNKYSKSLKEMIDLCLQKDPSKRPTSEKLIQHPFFKLAKKKDYLVKTLLVGLDPLEQRPHKRVPQKHNTLIKTSAWNFDEAENDHPADSTGSTDHEKGRYDQHNDRPSPSAEKKHIRFDTDLAPPSSDRERKHISFSDAPAKSPTSPQPNRSHSDALAVPVAHSPAKETELLVGLGLANSHVGFSEEPKRLERPSSVQSEKEVVLRKGRFSVTEGSGGHVPLPQRSVTPNLEKSLSCNDLDTSLARVGSTDNLADRRSFHGPGVPGVPLSREDSSSRDSRDSSSSRGRFSLEKDILVPPLPSSQTTNPQGRLSDERDRDAIETPSCGIGRYGRFEVSTDSDAMHTTNAPTVVPKDFKSADGLNSPLVIAGSDASSPTGSMSVSPSTSPSSSLSRGHSVRIDGGPVNNVYSHLETLIHQNEQQHALLSELFFGIGGGSKSNGLSVSQSTFPGNAASIHAGLSLYNGHWGSTHAADGKKEAWANGISEKRIAGTEVVNNMSQLDRGVKFLLQENESLRRDYESLRRDYESLKKDNERLRRSISATSINVAGGATSNAASADSCVPHPILVNGASKPAVPLFNAGASSPSAPVSLSSVRFEKPKDHLVKFEERRDS